MLYINGIDQSKAGGGGGGGGGGTALTRYNLGPVKDYSGCILYSGTMQNGEYTLTGSLDVARCLIVIREANDDPDTPGTITVEGTDAAGAPISEVVSVGDDYEDVITAKAFASVTSITGDGWSPDGTPDTLAVAGSNILGLPVIPASAEDVLMIGQPRSFWNVPNVTVDAAIAKCTIDATNIPLDGINDVLVYLKESS